MKRALLVATCVALSARAEAQSNGSVSADAVVVTVGMTIATLSDLNFGTVIKGVATSVAPAAVNAGEWLVSGSANAFVIITFTLPTRRFGVACERSRAAAHLVVVVCRRRW